MSLWLDIIVLMQNNEWLQIWILLINCIENVRLWNCVQVRSTTVIELMNDQEKGTWAEIWMISFEMSNSKSCSVELA